MLLSIFIKTLYHKKPRFPKIRNGVFTAQIKENYF